MSMLMMNIIIAMFVQTTRYFVIAQQTEMDIEDTKGCRMICESCPYLSKCTENRNYVKVITRYNGNPMGKVVKIYAKYLE
ncbi:hypothetical protein bsdcttw_38490 [Anaerocolumna chitinilytica]|uniref:Uncharacterized protein n=1 Tax=Anaerocolumna chitinilytica TaxID=1727145 RepID=A0A7I8DQV9_9FIRM|nr:hypothetical protein bsdcttw_38490 [Anaerocolumna chitinilytica]